MTDIELSDKLKKILHHFTVMQPLKIRKKNNLFHITISNIEDKK